MTSKPTLDILLDVYAYNHAWTFAKSQKTMTSEQLFLLEMLKERRELNIDFIFQQLDVVKAIEENKAIKLLDNPYEEELLANYIMDLEAKLRNGNIIDFVRSVSPILYRLFMRLIRQQLPDIDAFIYDTKNDQYDTWQFSKMHASSNPIIQKYVHQKRDSRLTSKGLVDLILETDLPQEIKDLSVSLQCFEKNVRNPLAHLIKAFDEEELHRTTGFSSQIFLQQIIHLAVYSGISYDSQQFYFDQINALIKAY